MTLTTLQLSNPYGGVVCQVAGQGEPLVLIHGVGMQSAAWGPQIDALAKTHRVIAVNMPGHGGSDPLPKRAELPDFVAWFDAVVNALDLGPINLIGHSMGALIAGGFAINHPEHVLRVAIVNGVYCRTENSRTAVETRATEIESGKIDVEAPLNRWFGSSEVDITVRSNVAHWLSEINLEGYATAYRAFARGDRTYAEGWSSVTCPMLALTGDGDANSTPEMSRAMARAAQNGHVEVLEGHRHMVNLTAPEAVNMILRDWLARPTLLEKNP